MNEANMVEIGKAVGVVITAGIISPLLWMGIRKFESWFWESVRRKKARRSRE